MIRSDYTHQLASEAVVVLRKTVFPFRVFRRHRSALASDEQVEFYPSYGYRAGDSGWRLVIQGCVFNPRLPWFRRRPVMAMIRRAMRVDRSADEYFRRRMKRFLLDAPKGRAIAIEFAGQNYAIGVSGGAGLFRGEIEVPDEAVNRSVIVAAPPTAPVRWLPYQAALGPGDSRQFTGRVQLIEPSGVSIVSDVDDTIKHSNVPNRRDLFHNTFSRVFRPIDGMAALYRECAARGAVFHFVSGSPWQLYEPLCEFLREHAFPDGAFHLKPFRIRDTARKIRGPQPQTAHKLMVLEPILAAFPQRRFVLIGDSGEQDPLIYGGLLRTRPEQILGVFIRSVRDETADAPRLQTAFADCPPDRWQVYRTADEIQDALLQYVSQGAGTAPQTANP